ncbi:MAG TPA: glycosyltransferase, partial [Oligoflexia bacterium]|nr:glycosyltransferase [Oligoflexia bacterium]
KQRLIQSAQVLCLVSANESFGIAYLEAWNHRLPVIGVNNMTSRCLIDDGINGILVPYGDANQLAARISSLLENPTVARSLGEAGHRKLQQLFADDVAKRRILDAIFN